MRSGRIVEKLLTILLIFRALLEDTLQRKTDCHVTVQRVIGQKSPGRSPNLRATFSRKGFLTYFWPISVLFLVNSIARFLRISKQSKDDFTSFSRREDVGADHTLPAYLMRLEAIFALLAWRG